MIVPTSLVAQYAHLDSARHQRAAIRDLAIQSSYREPNVGPLPDHS